MKAITALAGLALATTLFVEGVSPPASYDARVAKIAAEQVAYSPSLDELRQARDDISRRVDDVEQRVGGGYLRNGDLQSSLEEAEADIRSLKSEQEYLRARVEALETRQRWGGY